VCTSITLESGALFVDGLTMTRELFALLAIA
jgi:hypothetical protein